MKSEMGQYKETNRDLTIKTPIKKTHNAARNVDMNHSVSISNMYLDNSHVSTATHNRR